MSRRCCALSFPPKSAGSHRKSTQPSIPSFQAVHPWATGSDFSPASICGQSACTDVLPEPPDGRAVPAPSMPKQGWYGRAACPLPFTSVTAGLPWCAQTCTGHTAPVAVCTTPQALPSVCAAKSVLSLVCLLKPEFLYLATAHTGSLLSRAGECRSWPGPYVLVSLCPTCHRLAAALTSGASEVPCLSWLISQSVKGIPRMREPSLFPSSLPGTQVPSQSLLLLLFCLVIW